MLPLKVLGFGLTFDSRLERIHESIHLNWFIRPERNELNALWCWLLPLRPPPNTQSAVMCAKAHQSTDSGSERRSSPSPHSYETVLGFDVIARSLPLLRQHPPFSIRTLVGSVMVQAASCSTMVSAQWFSIDNSDFNPSLFVSSTYFFFISFWFVFTVFFKSVAYRDVLNRTGLSPDRDRRTDSWHGMVSRVVRSVGDVDAGTWRVGWWILIAMKVNEVDVFVAKENKRSVTSVGAHENDL